MRTNILRKINAAVWVIAAVLVVMAASIKWHAIGNTLESIVTGDIVFLVFCVTFAILCDTSIKSLDR